MLSPSFFDAGPGIIFIFSPLLECSCPAF